MLPNRSSPSPSLQPIKNAPRLPLGTSPSKFSTPTKGSTNHDNITKDLVRGLRRDVVELQHLIDEFEARPLLSAASRSLESSLFALEHQPMDVQLTELVRLVRERSQSVGEICCGNRAAESFSASYRTMSPVVGHLLFGCRELIALERDITAANLTTDMLIKPPPAATPRTDALSPQQLAGKQRISERARQRTHERDSKQASTFLDEAPDDTAVDVHNVSMGSNAIDTQLKLEGSTSHLHRASWVATDTTWLEQFQTELRSLGVESTQCSTETILRDVLAALQQRRKRSMSPSSADGDVEATPARRTIVDEQLRVQVAALSEELRLRDQTIHDIRTQLDASRFSPNRYTTIATVNDDPMSFHVEKQYRKDHQRSQMRILELERDYQQLFEAGRADRERSATLAREVEKLQSIVKSLESDAVAIRRARDEQEELFSGVSRTRKEEARMGAAAVAQLEGRVADLTTQLERCQTKHGILQGNFESLFDDWCDSQQRLEEAKVLRDYHDSEFEKYKEAYHQTTVERLERTQEQLMEAWGAADDNEGQKTVIRQQYDDSQQVVRTLHDESKSLLERIRASTEWKLLTVKAPEETKQLLARWQAMQADRERRESSALKLQAERITTFKQRAAAEIASRRAERIAGIDLVKAATVLQSYEMARAPQPVLRGFAFGSDNEDADNEMSSTGSRIPRDVRQAFVQDSSLRLVTFEQFWKELFPGEDL
ncbi:Hypothetical protein, putative [Bodo saltans]|uniref:Uncharacterized protein n=1 Tax=Bodo saltans TaxID=75058 RepID=A0A0S4JHE4_BODSA|nr:Hypothetical protein, putative [Bodo saltans]|eukprot:CUG89524.1 Hypothetical protein, putative [Bodo saltans]